MSKMIHTIIPLVSYIKKTGYESFSCHNRAVVGVCMTASHRQNEYNFKRGDACWALQLQHHPLQHLASAQD